MASYFMIHKFMNFCLYFSIYSSCGLKAAFCSDKFYTTFVVNSQTGKVEHNKSVYEESVTMMYRTIKEEALENVDAFENEPDHGLLGKSITRICNRLENYVFRYFILGFILVNILLRLLFTIIGLFFLICAPLCIVFAPFYMVMCAFVCLFCIDITVPSSH